MERDSKIQQDRSEAISVRQTGLPLFKVHWSLSVLYSISSNNYFLCLQPNKSIELEPTDPIRVLPFALELAKSHNC
jgi:hypothetical protein